MYVRCCTFGLVNEKLGPAECAECDGAGGADGIGRQLGVKLG
jgi:hypothetical protein